MDSALELLQKKHQKILLSTTEIQSALEQSKVVKKLTKDFVDDPFFVVFRLLCISEIPYAEKLPYTQKLLSYASEHLATEEGFSYTGKVKDIVPCYNAMLLEAYSRLGLVKSREVQKALYWIKKYQVFQRNEKTAWTHDGICKHGGCMHATPCYIGIGKSIRALTFYSEIAPVVDKEVEALIERGIRYMLQHKMFYRLSKQSPISAHITDFMFPQNYALSLTDLVCIAAKRNLWLYDETAPLKELVHEKQILKEQWKIDYIYGHKGYKAFGGKKTPSEWLTYYVMHWIS